MEEKKLNKEWLITLILWFLLGGLGIHRFYNGKVGTGILMLFTLGGFGIWWIVDGIIIIMGNFETDKGEKIPVNI